MVASENGKGAAGVRPRPLLDVFDPRAVHTDGHLMFGLAGDCAGVTADAHVLVDDKAVSHDVIMFIAEVTLGT